MKNPRAFWASIALISLFVVLLATLLEICAAMAWTARWAGEAARSRFGTPAILSLCAAVCVITLIELIRGRRWAWWSTLTMAAMVLAFGVFCLVCAFRPLTAFEHSEFPFLLSTGIMFALPGGITGALLNLPPVRRRFLG
jgi:hypothetical protein